MVAVEDAPAEEMERERAMEMQKEDILSKPEQIRCGHSLQYLVGFRIVCCCCIMPRRTRVPACFSLACAQGPIRLCLANSTGQALEIFEFWWRCWLGLWG